MSYNSGASVPDNKFPDVVSVEWLAERIGKVKLLDASWYLPTEKRDPIAEFKESRLPTAQFFDIDTIADPNSELPHMLPTEQAFGRAADALGIKASDAVVVYDRLGMFSAPRAWWTWHVFGHERVAVLDGGMPAWVKAGKPLETSEIPGDVVHAPGRAAREEESTTENPKYEAHLRADEVAHWKQVLELISNPGGGAGIVDARGAARWRGEAPEPRPGLASGHIPCSRNVPWDSILSEGHLRSADDLQRIFESADVRPNAQGGPLTLTCGTGTTACILALGVRRAFPGTSTRIYDGSWSEWGQLPNVPVEKSA